MYKSDLEIAQDANLLEISEVAGKLEIGEIHQYGKYMAKIDLDIMNENKVDGKLILVTAINPTKAGEGKSTTTIGLSDAINKIGYKSIVAIREPSLGPVFGMKGGAAGGGYAQVLPMEELNLHFTGDMHAITTANNLISACLDNHIYHGNELEIDIKNIVWRRCLDMNDRNLREIEIGLGSNYNGVSRKDGFNITVASEIMAILCLATSIEDLKVRLERIIIGYKKDNTIVYLKDLNISGALLVVLKDAIKPNLVQTVENNPVIVHGGPFANIAHGCNSIIATKTALKLGDYVVTEAGFGADLGAEKFLNIKSRIGDLNPDCIVIVATIRALKSNAYIPYDELNKENIKAMLEGCSNLQKHVENMKKFNIPFVIGINKFITDTDAEITALMKWAQDNDYPIELSEVWEHGGTGGIDLANKVVELCEKDSHIRFLYELNQSIENKIEIIAKEIYGARGLNISDKAQAQINELTKNGFGDLPICMAKTPISLSDDPKKLGCPENFDLNISELRISNGAGFIVVLTGSIMTMPGLPKHPSANDLNLNKDGKIEGLF